MRYIIYSFLIFSFLMIDFDVNAQKKGSTYNKETVDSLNQLGEKYNVVSNDTILRGNGGHWGSDGMFYANGDDNRFELDRTSRRFGAVISAYQLRENGLVVLLRTSSNRLEKLRILSRDKQLSEVQQQNYKFKISQIEQENKIINESLINSFAEFYSFSHIYFMYDSSLTRLKNGIQKGIFVNKKGEIDKSIELNTKDYYICSYTLASTSKETEGLVIHNSKMERVKEPFPGVAVSGTSGLNMLFQLFTDDKKYLEKKIGKDTRKLQENLTIFTERAEIRFKKP
ncbi:MAG: hypothetical protein AB8G11_20905 [Saprospiraceae bacterium]